MRCLILGIAKSGTTAALYAVARALGKPILHFEAPISTIGDLPADAIAKVIFEHEDPVTITRFAARFDRRILLLRDPRDTVISCLLYVIATDRALLNDDAFLTEFLTLLRRKQRAPASVETTQLFAMMRKWPEGFVGKALAIGQRFAEFHAHAAQDWFSLRYESFVTGDLAGLSALLGVPVPHGIEVDPAHARVARTRRAGDWRHWFTRSDISQLEPLFGPLMRRTGYEDGWEAAEMPEIEPEHSWRYVLRLIAERRKYFGIPPFEYEIAQDADARAHSTACPICGGTRFGPGPGGRTGSQGRMPTCLQCGSLERHRILWSILQACPPGDPATRRAIAFGRAACLHSSWFPAWTDSGAVPDRVDRDGRNADLIVLDHILEYVENDRALFDEFVRLLSSDGVLVICFAAPESRPVTQHFAAPTGTQPVRHRYGSDLDRHFGCAQKGLITLAIELADPSTGMVGQMHCFLKNRGGALALQRRLQARHPTIAIFDRSGTA